jgi:stalled ribosome rescue protein Dom34
MRVNNVNHISASDPATRKKYVGIVETTQQRGGEVLIFSSMHESGQRKDTHTLNSNGPPAE